MRFVALLAGALLAAATAAGCGSSEQQSPESVAATTYVECLRQEGIELGQGGTRPSGQPMTRPSGQPGVLPSGRPTAFPSGGPNGSQFGDQAPAGVDAQKWQAAMEKCGSLRPSGGVRGSGAPGGNSRFQAYQNCLSERGVTWTPGQTLPTSDPKVAEAEKACSVLRPSASAQ